MSVPKRTPALRKHLQELDREALLEELERLADRFPQVKKFLLADLSGDTSSIVQAARTQIERCFKTTSGKWRRPKASKLNAILRDFEAISVFEEDVLELLIMRLEQSAYYLNEFQMATSPIIPSSVRVFDRACELAVSLQLEEKYSGKLEWIISRFDDRQMRDEVDPIFRRHFPKG
jgi:hypothetical protein